MKSPAFSYYEAKDLADAINIKKSDDDAVILAGGQSLLPTLNMRLSSPSVLIDIGSISELKKIGVKIKFITDGDVSGALLVTDDKYGVDIFLGVGGGPEGVLAAAALDAFDCSFQGRFLFVTKEDKIRAHKMGIKDLTKKYELNHNKTSRRRLL